MGKLIDLTGQRFGKLVVLERDFENLEKFASKEARWKCKCDCGNIKTIGSYLLRSGQATTCTRCIEREEIGKKYGHLTILEFAGTDKKQRALFKCLCDCGKETVVSSDKMRRGHTVSCGCQKRSFGEAEILKILIDNNIPYQKEVSFPDLLSENFYPLRYDFAILNERKEIIRLIEFDGPQHYNNYNLFGDLKTTQLHDRMKNDYAKQHQIPLIRIPYKEKTKISLNLLLGDKYLINN